MTTGRIHEFDSAAFAVEPDEDESTSYRVYGRALARFVAGRLRAAGTPFEAILPKPFGWCGLLAREPFPLWIACSNLDGGTTRWSARVIAEPTLLQSTFGRADVDAAVARCDALLETALEQLP
jgi:hypothetical protein